MEITAETPIVQMTVGQLCDYLMQEGYLIKTHKEESGHRFVYGIKGIMELFKVSNVTAQRYKRGIIKDAVSQRGRIIVTDADLALSLFGNAQEKRPYLGGIKPGKKLKNL